MFASSSLQRGSGLGQLVTATWSIPERCLWLGQRVSGPSRLSVRSPPIAFPQRALLSWSSGGRTSGGGRLKPGRAPLKKLVTVTRPSFECFSGRGAAAQVVLGGKAYQVNVMVGDRASKQRVAEALTVTRSFNLAG